MSAYPELIERVLGQEKFLHALLPKEPSDRELLRKVQAADEATLSGEKKPGHPAMFNLVRGALLYALDELEKSHAIFQDAHTDLGSYWHGMVHRREGDFDNARYWFRRAGVLPSFQKMHRAARDYSADMGRQAHWDPYLLTGQCEQARFGDEERTRELQALQRVEFEVLFEYCWKQSALS